MTRRTTLAAAAALALSALPACGDGAHDARAEIEATLNAFMGAVAKADGAAACAQLTQRARKQLVRAFALTGDDCEDAVDVAALMVSDAEAAVFDDLRVRRVEVEGSRAEVADGDIAVPDAATPDRNGRPTVFRRAGGKWLIEDLG